MLLFGRTSKTLLALLVIVTVTTPLEWYKYLVHRPGNDNFMGGCYGFYMEESSNHIYMYVYAITDYMHRYYNIIDNIQSSTHFSVDCANYSPSEIYFQKLLTCNVIYINLNVSVIVNSVYWLLAYVLY